MTKLEELKATLLAAYATERDADKVARAADAAARDASRASAAAAALVKAAADAYLAEENKGETE